MTTLYGCASNGIELLEAVQQCSGILLQPSAVALLYTPFWSGFAQVHKVNGEVELILPVREAKRFDRSAVFEARVFSHQAELRWLKQWPNKGRAVLLTEEDTPGYLAHELEPIAKSDTINHTYLLWGEGASATQDELPTGWSRLTMARIGVLDVPYPLDARPAVTKSGERIRLMAREYLSVDKHGNVTVAEERLRGLARA